MDFKKKNTMHYFIGFLYKKDKNSGIILSEIVDEHNHGWDAIRYACCQQIAAVSGRSILDVL